MPHFQFGPFANEFPDRSIALILGFILLVVFLIKVPMPVLSWPALKGILNDRATRIEADETQVDRQLAEIRQLRDDYATRIRNIEAEERQRIDEAVREAETTRVEIIRESDQTALSIRRRAEEELGRERTRQRILLRQQIVQMTLDAAEHTVRTNTSAPVHRQLIQDFITTAGATSSASAPTQRGA